MRAVLALLLVATTARADVWRRALDRTTTAPSKDEYEAHLGRGDDLVNQATSRQSSLSAIKRSIEQGILEYKQAAEIRPNEGEPYFRMGLVLNNFYVECAAGSPVTCSRTSLNAVRALEVIQAWDTFEQKAPMDPRVNEMLFDRAIIRTKLVSATPPASPAAKKYLEGAAHDYQALIDRRDGTTIASQYSVVGNLAETYMMLDRLDDAVQSYLESIRLGGPASVRYGLAVALDRDDREAEAKEVIVAQGLAAKQYFQRELQQGEIFFVPQGEQFYYFALSSEAFDENAAAITYWNAYLQSGAHPEFQGRARAHLDALRKKPVQKQRPVEDDEIP